MKMIATIKAIDRHPFSYSSSSDGVFSLYQSNGCFNFISHSFLTPFFLLFSFITSRLLHYIRTIAIPVSFVIPTAIITLMHYLFLHLYFKILTVLRLLSCRYASFQCMTIRLEIGIHLIMYTYTAMLFFCIIHRLLSS